MDEKNKFLNAADIIFGDKDLGHIDIINLDLMAENLNKNNPTVIFYNACNIPFDGESIQKKPISGSETAIIQLAKNLKSLGWNSHVFCNTTTENLFYGVNYYSYKSIRGGLRKIIEDTKKDVEVFVSCRDVRPFLGRRPPSVKKTVLWIQDMPSKGYNHLLKAIINIDYLFFVSKFQADAFQQYFNGQIPEDKIFLTRNGIDENNFKFNSAIKKIRGRCIYTTTPFRGLDILLKMWPKIKEKVPKCELYVYSDMSIYDQEETPEIKRIFEIGRDLSKKYDIHFFKPVKQEELAKVLMKSDVMLYPNHFQETFCITAIESIKARTPVITTRLGALPETIREGEGILINQDPYSYEYREEFIKAAIKMLTDDNFRNTFCIKDRDMSWISISKEWNKFLKDG